MPRKRDFSSKPDETVEQYLKRIGQADKKLAQEAAKRKAKNSSPRDVVDARPNEQPYVEQQRARKREVRAMLHDSRDIQREVERIQARSRTTADATSTPATLALKTDVDSVNIDHDDDPRENSFVSQRNHEEIVNAKDENEKPNVNNYGILQPCTEIDYMAVQEVEKNVAETATGQPIDQSNAAESLSLHSVDGLKSGNQAGVGERIGKGQGPFSVFSHPPSPAGTTEKKREEIRILPRRDSSNLEEGNCGVASCASDARAQALSMSSVSSESLVETYQPDMSVSARKELNRVNWVENLTEDRPVERWIPNHTGVTMRSVVLRWKLACESVEAINPEFRLNIVDSVRMNDERERLLAESGLDSDAVECSGLALVGLFAEQYWSEVEEIEDVESRDFVAALQSWHPSDEHVSQAWLHPSSWRDEFERFLAEVKPHDPFPYVTIIYLGNHKELERYEQSRGAR